LYAIKVGR
jgi:hypothetical protein